MLRSVNESDNNNNNNINNINKYPSQCMKSEMSQCCGIEQYTETEKLQEIYQI